jgi:hypothetical protein
MVRRFAVTADLDRTTAEMLQLEIRRLAARCGLEVLLLRIDEVNEGAD